MQFIFVRHGQSQANADTVIADAHSPLTQNGIEQARRTGLELKDKGITRIICSPYLRARQTAEIIASEIGIDIAHIRMLDDLRERGLGVLEGKHRDYEGLWYFTDDASEGIEPRKRLFDRMKGCLDTIKRLGQHDKVLAVGHSISGFYLIEAAAGKSLDALDSPALMSNADYIEVDY
jgi:2,3-bisphosphoglycerate-dependent phosphoglycerate mutase